MTPSAAPPLFSVVVPTHDRQALLDDALQSLLDQTEESWECIVVDDASPTPPQVPEDPRIRLIRMPAQHGPAHCRNVGIAAARGTYLCFLDDDDVYPPTRLALDRRAGGEVPLLHWGGRIGEATVTRWTRRATTRAHLFDRTTPHLGMITVKRELAPMFDGDFPACEDIDWLLRLTEEFEFELVPEVGWLWRRHGGARGLVGIEARLRGSQLLMEKHHAYFATNRTARGFRLYRMGLLSAQLGNATAARHSWRLSIRSMPAPHVLLRTMWALMRQPLRDLPLNRARR